MTMMRWSLAILLVVLTLGCDTKDPSVGTSNDPPKKKARSTPTSSASPTPSASASEDDGAPWVRGLSSGCTEDDDCIKVRACTSYAIRRNARATFEERISGVRFKCERKPNAGHAPETRAACVDGTCKLI